MQHDGLLPGLPGGGQTDLVAARRGRLTGEPFRPQVQVTVGLVERRLSRDGRQRAVAPRVATEGAEDGEGEAAAGGVDLGTPRAHQDLALRGRHCQPREWRVAHAPVMEHNHGHLTAREALATPHDTPPVRHLAAREIDVPVLQPPLPPDTQHLQVHVLRQAIGADEHPPALLRRVGPDAVGQ